MLINLSFAGTKPTGLTTYATNLVPQLQMSEATLLVPGHRKDFLAHPHRLVPGNLTAEHGSRGHLRRLLWTQFRLSTIYSTERSQLLFSPIPEAPLWSGCRYVVMVHDLIPLHFAEWRSPLKYYFRYYVPLVLQQAIHIICNSQATAQDMVDYYGLAASKITPIPLAHDTSHFQYLDLPTQDYFIYIGRSDPYKNLGRIIQALAKLPKRFQLFIVGPYDDRYIPPLLTQAAELGIANQIKVLDYVPYKELPRLINQAIALVFPSLWEGFGFPVLEAMACGTPVITSNLASLPEVAGDAALLVNPYSVEELAAAMHSVATDEGVRSHLRNRGLARASQFSWQKTGQQTADLLRNYA
jgi:glycosyltransferase involved in cell wall biosynthesis